MFIQNDPLLLVRFDIPHLICEISLSHLHTKMIPFNRGFCSHSYSEVSFSHFHTNWPYQWWNSWSLTFIQTASEVFILTNYVRFRVSLIMWGLCLTNFAIENFTSPSEVSTPTFRSEVYFPHFFCEGVYSHKSGEVSCSHIPFKFTTQQSEVDFPSHRFSISLNLWGFQSHTSREFITPHTSREVFKSHSFGSEKTQVPKRCSTPTSRSEAFISHYLVSWTEKKWDLLISFELKKSETSQNYKLSFIL